MWPLLTSYKRTVMGFIFSTPVSFDPSIEIVNGCVFIAETNAFLKCGASEPLTMQVVLVLALA